MAVAYQTSCAGQNHQKEKGILSCCWCGASLEPVLLDTNAVTGEQRFLWTCRNVKKKLCTFPIGLPGKVFYVTRTAAEKKKKFVPKPNIRLLPAEFRGLYPSVFGNNRTNNPASRCETPMLMRAADRCSSYPSSQSPSTSRSSVSYHDAATDQLLQQEQENREERELFPCSYCGAALEPIILNTDAVTSEQRLLWVCVNARKKKCIFPIGLPGNVFYVTRTSAEKARGYIPKPNIRLLPVKFRGFYPSVFLSNRTSNDNSRCGTSMSIHTTDMCSSYPSTESPSTSRSSVSSHDTNAYQILQQRLENVLSHHDPSVWSEITTSGKKAVVYKPSVPLVNDIVDDRSLSTEINSDCTYSTTEETDWPTDETFSDFICDQLRNMSVDISRLEDEELIKKMTEVVKQVESDKLRNHLRYVTSSTYRVPFDYVYKLDVAHVKRKLSVLSTDLTRAVAVMRSGCSVETMLDAIGGSPSVAAPPLKRPRTSDVEQELKRRVDAVLKKLANSRCDIQGEVNTATDATSPDVDQSGTNEWYEGEDGPSTSAEVTLDHNAIAEQERLNAIVQNSIRSQIANSAARRSAYQRERMQGATQQALEPTYAQVSLPLRVDQVISAESCGDSDELSFDFSYLSSAGDFSQENGDDHSRSHSREKQLVSRESEFEYGLHSDPQSFENSEFDLFDDIIY